MKDWKIIIANGVITAVILFAGIKWLVPEAPSLDVGKIEETLAIQMERLQTRLNNMEQSLSKQKTPAAALSEQRKVPDDNLQKVERKLDVLLGKVTFLEQKLDATKLASGFGSNLVSSPNGQNQLFSKMGAQNPINWVENLSPEKRNAVDMIFEEHGRGIREKLPPPSEGPPPNREAIRKIFRENDEELRERLREVLSEEEYQSFLDSLPKKRPPFPGSGGPEQGSGGLR
jgi:hypothetical protein